MKKVMKMLFNVVLGMTICMTMIVPTFADEIEVMEPEDYGDPINEITYFDEELQATITEKSYLVLDNATEATGVLANKKESGWRKNTKEFEWLDGNITTTYAKGYFTWGNGNVTVSDEKGGYDYYPSDKGIVEEKLSKGTGKYAYVFNKYAYVKYTFKFKNYLGKIQDQSVIIRVSENGNEI